MGHQNYQPHSPDPRRAPGMPKPGARKDTRSRLLLSLQQFFEISRDQFDDAELRTPEWRQADDALERVYDACVGHKTIDLVQSLCDRAHRCIDQAVEISTARSYYDGRL